MLDGGRAYWLHYHMGLSWNDVARRFGYDPLDDPMAVVMLRRRAERFKSRVGEIEPILSRVERPPSAEGPVFFPALVGPFEDKVVGYNIYLDRLPGEPIPVRYFIFRDPDDPTRTHSLIWLDD